MLNAEDSDTYLKVIGNLDPSAELQISAPQPARRYQARWQRRKSVNPKLEI